MLKFVCILLIIYASIIQLAICHTSKFDEYPIAPPPLTDDQLIGELENNSSLENSTIASSEHDGLQKVSTGQAKPQKVKSINPVKFEKKDVQRLRRHGHNGKQEFGQQHQNFQNQQPNQIPCHNAQPVTLLNPYPLPPCNSQEQVNAQQANGNTYPQPNQFYGQQQQQRQPNFGAYATGLGNQFNGRGWYRYFAFY
ncbi:hypothetical protein M3Y97_00490500 [Aphelenchoides bicaudatus]|nr:hypothetical protein M3Y97_00490500 [Aphelenchoides bicaudatus]